MKHTVIRFQTGLPNYSSILHMQHNCKYSVYGNGRGELPTDAQEALGKTFIITHYVDKNLYYYVLTGLAVTGILHFINQTPIAWWSKKQPIAETAVYMLEFVTAKNVWNT